MGIYLDKIKEPNDIKKIPKENYPELCSEIRQFLIKNVSETGGHLASNLGAVELTVALHACLNFPEDKLIWDVGHQSYVHKILTGRKEQMGTLRTHGGLSGFPKEEESDCDAFNTGHSTTSISVAAGYAKGRDILGKDYRVVAVIGDGSFSGGMAYEAINNLAPSKTNCIVILNDNEMSISKNVGGMASYLENIRTSSKYIDFKGDVESVLSKTKVGSKFADTLKKTKNAVRDLITPGEFFKDMGLGYFGPIDGHNIHDLCQAIEAAKTYRGCVVVHVITKKGKGYCFAEKNPSKFHGVEPFCRKTGELRSQSSGESYTQVFGKHIVELAKSNDRIVAITAAMKSGTGLSDFSKEFPDRFFDVGIAEEHAVTFAGGLAAAGLVPFVCIYSTFLQRSYDQIIHDVCLTGKKVVFMIDRAGIVGNDGTTHQGVYDMAFLSTIPGLYVISPKDREELIAAMDFALGFDGPVAIRYPRGTAYSSGISSEPVKAGKAEIISLHKEVCVLSVGSVFKETAEACMRLENEDYHVSFINARFSTPIDTEIIDRIMPYHKVIVTVEEGVKSGGFGEHVGAYLLENGYKGRFINISLPNAYIEHGSQSVLREKYGLTADKIYDTILENIRDLSED